MFVSAQIARSTERTLRAQSAGSTTLGVTHSKESDHGRAGCRRLETVARVPAHDIV